MLEICCQAFDQDFFRQIWQIISAFCCQSFDYNVGFFSPNFYKYVFFRQNFGLYFYVTNLTFFRSKFRQNFFRQLLLKIIFSATGYQKEFARTYATCAKSQTPGAVKAIRSSSSVWFASTMPNRPTRFQDRSTRQKIIYIKKIL